MDVLPVLPYDKELASFAARMSGGADLTLDSIPSVRVMLQNIFDSVDTILSDFDVEHQERTIPGPNGDIVISILQNKNSTSRRDRTGIYHIHGGGMVFGNRWVGIRDPLGWMEQGLNAVCVTVEYRLAPEHPDPAPREDCYAGLVWVGDHLDELGIDAKRLMITGSSAGGGLAVGTTLLARDRVGPKLCAQLIRCPMLDDRCKSRSTEQFSALHIWSKGTNITAWTALLGDRRGTQDVSIYAAPNRAEDLSNFPPTFLDVGSAETFRDEVVEFAGKLWACGNETELHVWPGAFHGSYEIVPQARISLIANSAAFNWVKRNVS